MTSPFLRPIERLAAEVVDLNARLDLASEKIFYQAAELASLRSCVAETEELKKDKARLDFLSANPESVPYFSDGRWHIPYLHNGAGGFGGGVSEVSHPTLRGVIDLEMNRLK